MRHYRRFFPICLLLPLSAFAADFPAWLAGHWRTIDGKRTTDEVWLAPADGLMTGMSRSSGDGKPFFEFIRIHRRDAVLVYSAQPGGGSPTDFPLKSADADQYTFENPAHDFPQRIIYRRVDATHVTARIEGMIKGKPREEVWQYTRVAAPAVD
ncbi:DUF6265 family protein [Tahibacter amnicola]|uniref:DUF6265 family protein n=1 Tax=Tahibacter amnicola TaxID=2976241 RepID=A0ABY6BE17_9GAMM|nr:DUF6265 family protein [Tahibacter amnicola]UXI66866.1 DUF6265 family protein [Tahibacter amnicola]